MTVHVEGPPERPDEDVLPGGPGATWVHLVLPAGKNAAPVRELGAVS